MNIPDQRAMSLTEKVLAAMRDAMAALVDDHRSRGLPLAVWRDGKAVLEVPGPALQVREGTEEYGPRLPHNDSPEGSGE